MAKKAVVNGSIQKLMDSGELALSDVEAMGLVLHGGSVIDWHRLNFGSVDEVDRFLALTGHDIHDPFDRKRLLGLYLDAVDYLTETFEHRLPPEITALEDFRVLFTNASGKTGDRRLQVLSCVVLKVMHILHHAQARELLFMTPVSDRQIFAAVEEKVGREVVAMQKAGYPIYHFSGSRRTLHGQVTRLLAEREVIAARVHDKASFQIVTEKRDDILPVLWHLTRTVFPFNYVVPGTSCNAIIDFLELVKKAPRFSSGLDALQFPAAAAACTHDHDVPHPKAIDFVVDLPLRLPEMNVKVGDELQERLGRVVFALVEFQLQDLATFKENESGGSSIAAQRKALKKKAWERLAGGKLNTPP